MNNLYISHRPLYARHTAFDQSAACLSVFLKLPPGLLTQKLLKQGYQYHKLRKTFSGFYRRYYDLISKFQIGLRSLLRRGLSDLGFCGGLVCRLGRIVDSDDFSARFVEVVFHYKKIGCGIGVLQRAACLVVGLVTVGSIAFLFSCAPVGRASDSMTVPT